MPTPPEFDRSAAIRLHAGAATLVETDALLGLAEVLCAGTWTELAPETDAEPESGAGRPRQSPSGPASAAAGPERSSVNKGALRQTPIARPLVCAAERIEGDLDREQRIQALAALRERHDRECPHCTVATGHTQTVFGEGDPEARLMFVGEAPGETEDQVGRPFVGKAGQKLDEMIKAMGLARSQVYIANVLKSRPPDNRTPLQHEVEGCGPFLVEQIRIIRPVVIVTLGGPATKLLLGTEQGITRLRGIWGEFHDVGTVIPVMPTFHPAYLLRNYTLETRRQVWHDLQAAQRRIQAFA